MHQSKNSRFNEYAQLHRRLGRPDHHGGRRSCPPSPLAGKVWGEAEPEDLSGERRPAQPPGRASAKPSASPVRAAHAALVTALAGHPPRPIPVDADVIDLEDRADHLDKVLGALSVYLTVILDDTAQNVPGRLDLRDAEAILADLASDLSGTIQLAANGMAGRVA
jgi:hypothetical protein